MSNPNPDHFTVTPAFIAPQNFALISIPILPEAALTELNPIQLPIIIQNEPKKINPTETEKKDKKEHKNIEKELIGDFEWISYVCEKKEINYVNDFMEKKDPALINFKGLDLPELEDVAIINVPKEFSSVAQDQYKRLLRFGGLDTNENIAMKSGAIDQDHYNDKYNDFYDLNDPWICDEEEQSKNNTTNIATEPKEKKDSKKMAIAEVYYKDFSANKGNLSDFLKTQGYNDRLKLIDNFDNIMDKEETTAKRKRPEKEKKSIENTDQKPGTTKKKPKKKVKPNTNEVEFINTYPMSNPFLAPPFPDNNFVVSNLKFNPFVCKNMVGPPSGNILANISPGMINDQFMEKLKNEQGGLANLFDLSTLGNVGVDLFNLIITNGNKLPPGFTLPPDFQIDNILKMPTGMEMQETQDLAMGNDKNNKKKQRSLDFKAKNEKKNTFPSNENKNVYIEISENEDEPEKDKNK